MTATQAKYQYCTFMAPLLLSLVLRALARQLLLLSLRWHTTATLV